MEARGHVAAPPIRAMRAARSSPSPRQARIRARAPAASRGTVADPRAGFSGRTRAAAGPAGAGHRPGSRRRWAERAETPARSLEARTLGSRILEELSVAVEERAPTRAPGPPVPRPGSKSEPSPLPRRTGSTRPQVRGVRAHAQGPGRLREARAVRRAEEAVEAGRHVRLRVLEARERSHLRRRGGRPSADAAGARGSARRTRPDRAGPRGRR